jgi:hypothetical protein
VVTAVAAAVAGVAAVTVVATEALVDATALLFVAVVPAVDDVAAVDVEVDATAIVPVITAMPRTPAAPAASRDRRAGWRRFVIGPPPGVEAAGRPCARPG